MLRRIFTKLVDGLLDPTDYKQVALRADERARRAEDALAEEKLRNQARAEISREDLRDLQVERDRLKALIDLTAANYAKLCELPAPERGIVWAMAQVKVGKKVSHPVLDGGHIVQYATRADGQPIYHLKVGYSYDSLDSKADVDKVLRRFAGIDGWEVVGDQACP